MKNFKAFALATVAAVAGFTFAPTAVEAKSWCNKVAGFDVCYKDNGKYGADRIVVWAGNRDVADMNVICTGNGGNRWEANRDTKYISYGDLEALANRWCDNY